MNVLNSYYTQDVFSKLMIDNLNYIAPDFIIDIGIGEGSLCSAAYRKWSKALFYGFDADLNVIKHIEKTLPYVNVELTDSLTIDFIENTTLRVGTVDIAVCNPPYLKVKQDAKYNQLFRFVGLQPCSFLKYLTADLIFLAQNLKLLKPRGILGIIVPDSLLTNYDFRDFRLALLNNYWIEKIIQLPDSIFKKTEARTHILIINKQRSLLNHTRLFEADKNGSCSAPLLVSNEQLVSRMDYKYHIARQKIYIAKNSLKLSDAVEQLNRGYHSGKELRELNISYLHLSNISKKYLFFPDHRYATGAKYTIAQKGDIIVTRVGKRSVGKVAKIVSGRIAISDCLFVIRPKKGFATLLWKSLNSPFADSWLKMVAHGVCSQVISKVDLLEFQLGGNLK